MYVCAFKYIFHKFIDYIICIKDVLKAAAIATTFVQENGQQADSVWNELFVLVLDLNKLKALRYVDHDVTDYKFS